MPWLTETLPGFGERLGAVLFRIDAKSARDDGRLAGLLAAWPTSIPLVVEAQNPTWHVDETFAALRDAGAVLCTTDLDDREETPDIRRTGPFLYLRLRRTTYDDAALDAWAARIAPFLDDGMDAYVLFRHDEDGTSALHAGGVRGARRSIPRGRLRRATADLGHGADSAGAGSSAGPNTTTTRSSPVMSWKRCGTRPGRRSLAGTTVACLVPGCEPAGPGEHHVDLVLGVRLLLVRGAGRQDVEPERQVGDAQELDPRAAAALAGARAASAG